MCFGNWPLVITLWLTTVSAAMSPTIAFGKLLPFRWSAWTFSMPYRVIVSGRAWSSTMITTCEGFSGAACAANAGRITAASETSNASQTILGNDTGATPLVDNFVTSPRLSYLIYLAEVNGGRFARRVASVIPMDTFTIGGDLEVHRLGFGAMRITGDGIWGPPDDPDEARRLLRRVVELGIDLIDTADSYGPEVSENLIAEALHPYPEGLVIATKGGLRRTGPGQWPRDARPERLKECCEGSLRRLRLERIDLYQLHSPDPEVPLEDSLGALRELQEQGKVRHIGVSNVSVSELERAREVVEVVTVQNRFNLADRAAEDVLDASERQGLGFIPWFPLATGDLARPGTDLDEIARIHDATPSQVALAWLLARSPVMLPIPGTASVEHLEENLGAADIELSRDEVVAIGSASGG